MCKRKRLTRYYVIEQQGNRVFISHQPRWLFYFADSPKFFEERSKAYGKLARLLAVRGFWKSTAMVTSRSLTIDFAREFAQTDQARVAWYDKPGLVMLWLTNMYNWRFSRLRKLLRVLSSKRVSRFLVERDTFIDIFERR